KTGWLTEVETAEGAIFDLGQGEDHLEIRDPQDDYAFFEWDPSSGRITRDRIYRYEVRQDQEQVVVTQNHPSGSTVTRSAGTSTGVDFKRLDDGAQVFTHRVAKKGPSFNQVQRMEVIPPGQTERIVVMENTFNAQSGRLTARQWRRDPFARLAQDENRRESARRVPEVVRPNPRTQFPVQELDPNQEMRLLAYLYDEEGRHTKTLVDRGLLLEQVWDEEGNLVKRELAHRFRETFTRADDGTYEGELVLDDQWQQSLTGGLITQQVLNTDRLVERQISADGRSRSFTYDDQGRIEQVEMMAPDGKTLIEREQRAYLEEGKVEVVERLNLLTRKREMIEYQLGPDGRRVSSKDLGRHAPFPEPVSTSD
ncbi:MAG: hypothetical protein AAF191_17485, partial [Verrucomicrobiota bacterium]